ncbi:ABC transporter permease [Wenzhouxiangella marina]|uniref:Permease n=1 Tax=Wenzhouxiangella marina TaxID=1579979 RepID=A0A0K0XS91_9GAMM|nr:ABC transporter permease [Wenzhouxiangella marina]AKS40525.1 Permease [Wenzhouxiangella marina]MBB6088151.1 putative permease [Wenzhouxiangella marina]
MPLLTDIRMALRQLLKRPGFALAVVITLALGIGANAAIFSLFHQMLIEPIEVPAPERLVNLESPGPKYGSVSTSTPGGSQATFSYPMLRDLQQVEGVFSGLAGHRGFGANFAFDGVTTSGFGLQVTGSYFPTLAIQPALGRLLDENDDRTIGERRVAVLDYRFWVNELGGDPNILGRNLIVNGISLEVVGVAPDGFRGTTLGNSPDVYVPITLRWLLQPRLPEEHEDRRSYWVYAFGRLAPGVSVEQASDILQARYRAILEEIEAPLQSMPEDVLARFVSRPLELQPGELGQSNVRRDSSAPLSMLLTVSGLVLLIACVNVANLLLLRGASRSAELAVRTSIGATRGRLLVQLLTESVLLAILGGLLGVVVAGATLALIGSILPPPAAATVVLTISPAVLGAALFCTLLAVLIFGLAPAWHAARVQPAMVLRAQAGQPGGGRGLARFRNLLVLIQIALSVTLLITSGLFARSLHNLQNADLGMQIESVVSFGVSPTRNGYSQEQTLQLYERLEEELGNLPGVLSATSSMVPLIDDSNWTNNVSVEGFEPGPDSSSNVALNEIGLDYFETLGIPLLAGRSFESSDRFDTPRVAIVNQRFAEQFGLTPPIVGKRMAIGETEDLNIEIVGVVGDTRYANVRDGMIPLYYLPNRQNRGIPFMTYYARSALPPEQMMASIRELVSRLDPNLPVDNLYTMDTIVQQNVFLERFVGLLSTGFALLATFLAAIGLYGVLSYSVTQRTRELGLRMALGASPGELASSVMRQIARIALIGALIGLAAALVLGRFAASLLYELSPHDPLVLIGALVVLALVAGIAGYLPARRASRIHPNEALRYE